MNTILYGYDIINGKAAINPDEAGQVQELFHAYLSGCSLDNAAKKAGIPGMHAGIKRLLSNTHYLGDDFYPQIIDAETFQMAKDERLRRAGRLGRSSDRKKTRPLQPAPVHFCMDSPDIQYDDPEKQAEYLYSLIRKEEN